MYKQYLTGALLLIFAIGLVACGGEKEQKVTDKSAEVTTQAGAKNTPEAKLNINTASEEQFRAIPNVGDKMVHEFEEYRPYVSIQQFRKEIGKYVDESRVANYEQYIFVPIHRNDSDVATLAQIPGLDKEEAQKIAGERPYESNASFFAALSSYINEKQLATAKTYMKAE